MRRKIELQSEEINTLKAVIVGLVNENTRLGLDNQRFIRKVEELNQLIKAILPPSEVDHLAKFVNEEA